MDACHRPPVLRRKIRQRLVILVDAFDTTRTNGGTFEEDSTSSERLADTHVGTVLVCCPVGPAIPAVLRPWQAGRMHLDGVRREEKTWPDDDFVAYRNRVASLMESTAPGDVRWHARHPPVVTCQVEMDALPSPSPDMAPAPDMAPTAR